MSSSAARRAGAWVVGGALLAACVAGCGGGDDEKTTEVHTMAADDYRGWWLALSVQNTAATENGVSTTITLAGDAEFAAESTELSAGADEDLAASAAALGSTQGVVTIAGHTAITDTPAANLTFSAARAENVRAALVARHVDPGRLHVVGCGQEYPQSTGTAPSDQARNRVVVIRVAPTVLETAEACAPVAGR